MIATQRQVIWLPPKSNAVAAESNANVFDFKLPVHIMVLLSKARNDQIEAEALSLQKALL